MMGARATWASPPVTPTLSPVGPTTLRPAPTAERASATYAAIWRRRGAGGLSRDLVRRGASSSTTAAPVLPDVVVAPLGQGARRGRQVVRRVRSDVRAWPRRRSSTTPCSEWPEGRTATGLEREEHPLGIVVRPAKKGVLSALPHSDAARVRSNLAGALTQRFLAEEVGLRSTPAQRPAARGAAGRFFSSDRGQ